MGNPMHNPPPDSNRPLPVPELTDQLASPGGAIVLAAACEESEVRSAQTTGRFAVSKDGRGFIGRTQDWLEAAGT